MRLLLAAVAALLLVPPAFAAGPLGGFQFPPSWPPNERCVAFLAGHPDAFKPIVCYFKPAGFDCLPEQNPPAGWLRPGGYCDLAKATNDRRIFFGNDPAPKCECWWECYPWTKPV